MIMLIFFFHYTSVFEFTVEAVVCSHNADIVIILSSAMIADDRIVNIKPPLNSSNRIIDRINLVR